MIDDGLISGEELFEEIGLEPKNTRPVARQSSKKAKKDIFAGIKVKMVMRIYGVSKKRALEIIAGRAAEKKALADGHGNDGMASRKDEGGFMSAKDFFGEVDG